MIPEPFDIIIRNGTVVDGTGTPGFSADVGIRGDRIAALCTLNAATAITIIDAAGLIVAPGFIDAHTHDDAELIVVFVLEGEEAVAVVEGGVGVVDGAGADDDEEAVERVGVLDYGDGCGATGLAGLG